MDEQKKSGVVPYPDVTPLKFEGELAGVNVKEVKVTRKKEPDSIQLRKNGTLSFGTAVWCLETQIVDGVERVHLSHPCDGWVNKSDIVFGQVVVVNTAAGATVRSGIELDSEVVGELPFDARAFVVEKNVTYDGKSRARIIDPVEGWISVKCVLPICDRVGEIQGAGKTFIKPEDVDGQSMVYAHYVELDCNQVYKNLWEAGLMYGENFRMLKRAWRTDAEAFGIVGPLKEEAEGWLVHPALADSMLHLTTVAPDPPEGGWPFLKDEEAKQAAAPAA